MPSLGMSIHDFGFGRLLYMFIPSIREKLLAAWCGLAGWFRLARRVWSRSAFWSVVLMALVRSAPSRRGMRQRRLSRMVDLSDTKYLSTCTVSSGGHTRPIVPGHDIISGNLYREDRGEMPGRLA